MEKLIHFLIEIGNLKKMKRRGWVLRGVKNPETIADHSFRLAILGWFLAKKGGFNPERVIKLALIHDLCEIYSGDITPYDEILPENKKEKKELLERWPRFSVKKKKEYLLKKHKKEWQSLKKLISVLSVADQKEIINLWCDYELGLTKEGRFVKQIDKVENLLQALEYWKEDKNFPIVPWWIEIKEKIDDSLLLEFIDALDKKFHSRPACQLAGGAGKRKNGMPESPRTKTSLVRGKKKCCVKRKKI